MLNYGSGQMQANALAGNYDDMKQASAMPQNGLARLAEQLAEATARISGVTDGLERLSLGIHGPRPEPVSGQGANSPVQDSLAARVSHLLDTVDRLGRSYEAVIR